MRLWSIVPVLVLGLGLASCSRDNHAAREQPNARQAGRDAYRAAQQAKRDLKQAEHDIQSAGKEFREGWNEARSADKNRHESGRRENDKDTDQQK